MPFDATSLEDDRRDSAASSILRSVPGTPPCDRTGIRLRRGVILGVALVGVLAPLFAVAPAAVAAAEAKMGLELARLLQFMTMTKGLFVAGILAAVVWRLGVQIRTVRFAAYVVSVAAMGAGAGLTLTLVHLGFGAALLHGGLAAGAALLFTDNAISQRFDAMLRKRRSAEEAWRKLY